ncbi:MAG: TlpA family protein disulfide reductase [Acidobacteriota bacterium]|nr:TlpA family protein disulfide reductase [Acidobacteriota bacterium]
MARIRLRKFLRHRRLAAFRPRNRGHARAALARGKKILVRASYRGPGSPDIIEPVKSAQYFFRLIAIVLAAFGAGTFVWSFQHDDASSKSSASAVKDVQLRKQAPDFELKDAQGKTVKLSDYKGKVVLLDFWATWCGPCGIEIPWFTEFQRKYKDRGFEVLGVSMDDDGWKAVSPFVAQNKINYRIVLGNDATGDQYGGVEALPTTFVIDRDGKIASIHVGLTSKKDFSDAIEKLLDTPATSRGA